MYQKYPTQNIMNAICNMDEEGLFKALPDDELYFEMKKPIFLDKVIKIFDDLKIRGNKCFNVHPGKCKSSICSNTGCNGFTFVSDFTKEHISIVLQYKENIFDDWSHCHDMSTNTIILDDEKNIKIQVWNEDRHDFEASDDFLQTISDVKQAKVLLSTLSLTGITKSSLLLWLDRNEDKFINNYYFKNYRYKSYMSFSDFGRLFYTLSDLGTIVKNETKFIRIISEMKFTKRKRHLQLFDENQELLTALFRADIYRKDGNIQLTSDGVVYNFDNKNFKELFDFMELSYGLIYKY